MGRGSSKVGGGGGSIRNNAPGSGSLQLMRKIDSVGFKNRGGGVWDIDIPGIGGAQILDETGSSRALRAGFMPSQKAYSYNVWDQNGNNLTTLATTSVYVVDSLNTAKDYAKRILKNHSQTVYVLNLQNR